MSIIQSFKRLGTDIISKTKVSKKALTMIEANTRIDQLEAQLTESKSPQVLLAECRAMEYQARAMAECATSNIVAVDSNNNTAAAPLVIHQVTDFDKMNPRQLSEARLVDSYKTQAKSGFTNKSKGSGFSAAVDYKALAGVETPEPSKGDNLLRDPQTETYKQPTFDPHTRELTGGKNFYHIVNKAYFIAMLVGGLVVIKQDGNHRYNPLVQPRFTTDLYGNQSYANLTQEQFTDILKAKPSYEELSRGYFLVSKMTFTLEGSDAQVLW